MRDVRHSKIYFSIAVIVLSHSFKFAKANNA